MTSRWSILISQLPTSKGTREVPIFSKPEELQYSRDFLRSRMDRKTQTGSPKSIEPKTPTLQVLSSMKTTVIHPPKFPCLKLYTVLICLASINSQKQPLAILLFIINFSEASLKRNQTNKQRKNAIKRTEKRSTLMLNLRLSQILIWVDAKGIKPVTISSSKDSKINYMNEVRV